jgi:hypothetical protein
MPGVRPADNGREDRPWAPCFPGAEPDPEDH